MKFLTDLGIDLQYKGDMLKGYRFAHVIPHEFTHNGANYSLKITNLDELGIIIRKPSEITYIYCIFTDKTHRKVSAFLNTVSRYQESSEEPSSEMIDNCLTDDIYIIECEIIKNQIIEYCENLKTT